MPEMWGHETLASIFCRETVTALPTKEGPPKMTCPNPDLALSRARTQINTRARVGCRPRARRRTGSGSGARRRRQTTRRPHGGAQRYPGSAPPTSPTRCGHRRRRSLRPPPPPSCRCRGRLDTGFSRAIAAGFGRRTVDGPPVGTAEREERWGWCRVVAVSLTVFGFFDFYFGLRPVVVC
jgi:hypothetical protein